MKNPVARLGDTSSHGGKITTSCKFTVDDGQLVARVGDTLACPIHGPNPILTGSPVLDVEGSPAARSTSVTACGAQIIGGSTTLECE